VAVAIDNDRLLAGSSMTRDDDITNNDNKKTRYYFGKNKKGKIVFSNYLYTVFGDFTEYFW
jgi:hypothetical protein